MTQVLVTGGAGFIGFHLCRALLQRGCHVLCLDDLSSGQAAHIEALRAYSSFAWIDHDVCQPITPRLSDWRFDRIYHLACPASPVAYQRDAVRTLLTCVQGTLHALELARRDGARLFQASTSEVYGDPACHPQPEDYWGHVNPIGVRACYDEGKRAAEALCFDYARQHGVAVRVARLFNTYGPGMRIDDGRVLNQFVAQALTGAPLTLHGDGRQTRSLCYIDDTVEGVLRFMEQSCSQGPLNLGNPHECTMLELAQATLAATGSSSRIEHRPARPDDPRCRQPDIARARQLIDWSPRIGLHEGLARLVADLRTRLQQPEDA